MSYHGRFRPQHPEKYKGDASDVIYRSSWERACFKWCDTNDSIISWSSEEVVIPYRCKTDNEVHRYFVDMLITFKTGKTFLVEIKPKKQIMPPVRQNRVTKRYLGEVLQYAKNVSKWEAAKEYALDRGWEWYIWTEEDLKKLGIPIMTQPWKNNK